MTVTRGVVYADYHQFAVSYAGGNFPGPVVSENGLADLAEGGVIIKTGISAGLVHVLVEVRTDPLGAVDDSWDEIVEVSLDPTPSSRQYNPQEKALLGLTNAETVAGNLRIVTMMGWPSTPFPRLNATGGPCRLRVHARGRADNYDGVDEEPREEYLLATWPAPMSEVVIHKLATDL